MPRPFFITVRRQYELNSGDKISERAQPTAAESAPTARDTMPPSFLEFLMEAHDLLTDAGTSPTEVDQVRQSNKGSARIYVRCMPINDKFSGALERLYDELATALEGSTFDRAKRLVAEIKYRETLEKSIDEWVFERDIKRPQ